MPEEKAPKEPTSSEETKSGTSAPEEQTFSSENLSNEQLMKVLEDKRLWDSPRLKELREQASLAKKLKQEQESKEEENLKAQKKFEELAQKKAQELESSKKELETYKINQAIQSKLFPLNVIDMEAALQLVNRSILEIGDDGSVKGIDKAIKELQEQKAYLFGKQTTQLGTANGVQEESSDSVRFKRSQLKDPVFFNKHRDKIIAAMNAGLIEDDLK